MLPRDGRSRRHRARAGRHDGTPLTNLPRLSYDTVQCTDLRIVRTRTSAFLRVVQKAFALGYGVEPDEHAVVAGKVPGSRAL